MKLDRPINPPKHVLLRTADSATPNIFVDTQHLLNPTSRAIDPPKRSHSQTSLTFPKRNLTSLSSTSLTAYSPPPIQTTLISLSLALLPKPPLCYAVSSSPQKVHVIIVQRLSLLILQQTLVLPPVYSTPSCVSALYATFKSFSYSSGLLPYLLTQLCAVGNSFDSSR